MYRIHAEFTGLVPIMFNRFFNASELDDAPQKRAKTSWKELLTQMMWIDPKKGVYIPADNIRMMLIGNKLRTGAAKIFGTEVETKKGRAYVDFCKACVWVVGTDGDPSRVYFKPKHTSYDDYDERSFINAQLTRSLIRRPLLNLPWSVAFEVQVTSDLYHESKIRQLYELAGLRCGLGAYGPTFGRCEISKWEPIDSSKAT